MEDLLWLVSFADDDDRELTTPEVANALGAGQIHLGTLVWRDGMAEWQPITDLPELGGMVARHRAMSMALKKRQTVLGGFRAAPLVEAPAAQPLPPLATAPTAGSEGPKPDVAHPTGLSNGPALSSASTPDADPPTLRQSVPPSIPTAATFSATATPRQDQSLAGFQPVPNRRGFSRGRSLEGDGLDDDGQTGEAFNRAEDEGYPSSVDSEGFLKIPSEELSSVPRVEFEDESTPSEGNSAARLSARQLSWRPDDEPSSPIGARVDQSALAEALQIARVPRFDATSDAGDAQVEVLAKRPRVRPPINPNNYSGPARTIPPRAGISAAHVETYGAPLNLEAFPAPKRSGTKRWFLGGMAAIALASVAFLAVHFGDSELEQLTQRATEPSARIPSRTFAAQPASSQLSTTPSTGAAVVAAPAEPSAAAVAAVDTKPKVNSNATLVVKASSTPPAKATVSPRPLPLQAAAQSPAASGIPGSTLAEARQEKDDAPSSRSAAVDSKPTPVNSSTQPAPSEPPVLAEFDRDAATSALDKAATDASSCRKEGDPSGVARVSITFSDSGRATRATVDGPPFAGTATGGCIAEVMRKARIPAYAGDHITVKKTVVIQ